MRLRAPGKLILFGEYAVLEGAPGVVVALKRYARLFRSAKPGARAGLLDGAYNEARHEFGLGEQACPYEVDSRAFYAGRDKLGFGSSAAVAVLATAAAACEAGLRLEDSDLRVRLWHLARRAQRRVQGGRGSGLDLAAALFGGATCLRLQNETPHFSAYALPHAIRLDAYWMGAPASTSSFLSGLARFGERAPDEYAARMDALGALARHLTDETLGPEAWLAAFADIGTALDALGESAGLGIVTSPMRTLMQAARALGGAAKPSGAGGGDFMIAAFLDEVAAERFADTASAQGATRMTMEIDHAGLCRDEEELT